MENIRAEKRKKITQSSSTHLSQCRTDKGLPNTQTFMDSTTPRLDHGWVHRREHEANRLYTIRVI